MRKLSCEVPRSPSALTEYGNVPVSGKQAFFVSGFQFSQASVSASGLPASAQFKFYFLTIYYITKT